MKVLYNSTEVQQAVRRLFATAKGRRIAITAFVGNNAIAYLPKPRGIELVCWPKAGGTNPNAVRDLMEREVDVSFANRVHMKVYWTEDKGAIVTSANLSTSALGSGSLKEIGVLLPSDAVNIERVLASVNPHPVSETELDKLDKAHRAYFKANPDAQTLHKGRGRSFKTWYSMRSRSKWKIGWYYSDNVPLSRKVKAVLEKEHGSQDYQDILTAGKGYFEENEWLLCFNVEGRDARWISWMFAHHVVKVSSSDKRAYDPTAPFQVIQVFLLRTYEEPFAIDTKFKRALIPFHQSCFTIVA